ncbi:MAG: class A beta-lactamase-related serine hydrolase [Negativicutes bacterium]|nr:class A beta-lactamase-related serine hydrolase [Negativicutes bacterium]
MPAEMIATCLEQILGNQPGCYSVAIKDLSSGRQWLHNPCRMRSASLIKIFIMIEAFRQTAQGRLNLDEKTLVTDAARVGGAGPLEHAPAGTMKTWYDLVDLMIVESDNTATNLLIDKLSMADINTMITRLGYSDTVLRRKMMDFASAGQGRENYTTVLDITSVLEKLYLRRCLDTASDDAMLAILRGQQDKCKIPLLLPKNTVMAHKTGELDGAEHDAAIVYGPGCHYILTVMTDGLPDALSGQETIAKLSLAVYDELNKID